MPTYGVVLLGLVVLFVFVCGFGVAFAILKKGGKDRDPPTQMAFAASFSKAWVESSWNSAKRAGRSPGSPGLASLSRPRQAEKSTKLNQFRPVGGAGAEEEPSTRTAHARRTIALGRARASKESRTTAGSGGSGAAESESSVVEFDVGLEHDGSWVSLPARAAGGVPAEDSKGGGV